LYRPVTDVGLVRVLRARSSGSEHRQAARAMSQRRATSSLPYQLNDEQQRYHARHNDQTASIVVIDHPDHDGFPRQNQNTMMHAM
jgi:hypothetical protein